MTNLDQPTDRLQYEHALIDHVIANDAVRPEVADAMRVRKGRIRGELATRQDGDH